MRAEGHHGDMHAEDTCLPRCYENSGLELGRVETFETTNIMLQFHGTIPVSVGRKKARKRLAPVAAQHDGENGRN